MAGVSTREIKNRIRSMESTRQITRAMEMVAAARLRHTQARLAASRPYFQILRSTIDDIAAATPDFSSPYPEESTASKALFIVIAGDRGLAGGYNGNVLKLAFSMMEGREAAVLPIGRKAVDFFRSRGIPLLTDTWAEAAEVDAHDCFRIAKSLSTAYLSGSYGQIHVVYTNFVSVLSQSATSMRMLPLAADRTRKKQKNRCLTIFEPDPETVFDSIVPEYLGGILYGALCESRCAEQAARRTAMDSATRNAGDMIADLSLKYNRARQAAITQEITEIVAGSDA